MGRFRKRNDKVVEKKDEVEEEGSERKRRMKKRDGEKYENGGKLNLSMLHCYPSYTRR